MQIVFGTLNLILYDPSFWGEFCDPFLAGTALTEGADVNIKVHPLLKVAIFELINK